MLVARWWCVNNWMHFETFAHISNCWNDDTQMGWQVQSWWQVHGCSTAAHFSVLRPGEGQCEMQECWMHYHQAVPSCIYLASYRGWNGMRMWGLWEWVSLVTPGCHMPHQSGHNKELGVVQLSIYYLLSTYLHIYHLHIYTLGAEASVHNILWIIAEICHIKQWHSLLKCSQFRQTHSTTELYRSVSR